jgi:hypothetical protein
MFKNKYRIVKDCYCGYEAQVKFWWFPLCYFQMHNHTGCNTWSSVEQAENFIKNKSNKVVKKVDL